MCCRYYFADQFISEVEGIADFVADSVYAQIPGDIHPADLAPVLFAGQRGAAVHADLMRWGFPSFDHKLLINGRAESVLENERRFVVLTTEANASMSPVHDRMPLILNPEQIEAWLMDSDAIRDLLGWKPGMLEREAEYEQLSLF